MKRVVLTDLHVRRDGTLLLQWQKQMSDDGKTWENLDFHRTSVPLHGDVDAQIAAVNTHLASMGFASGVDPADVARAKAHVTLAQSDTMPLSDNALEARVETENARKAEIESCRAAVDEANKTIAALNNQLRIATTTAIEAAK